MDEIYNARTVYSSFRIVLLEGRPDAAREIKSCGNAVGSVTTSCSEVRELESHSDSDEVTLFLSAVYHHYKLS